MANLTEIKKGIAGQDLDFQRKRSFPVATGLKIFKGATVSVNASGEAIKGISTSLVVGIAMNTVDNSAGAVPTVRRELSVRMQHTEVFPNPGGLKVEDTVIAVDDSTIAVHAAEVGILGQVHFIPDANLIHIRVSLRA